MGARVWLQAAVGALLAVLLGLGASVVVSGIPDFSHLPPSSRLQGPDGATVTVDMQNRPCQFPAMTIEAAQPGHGKAFRTAAKGLRGVTAWVEREGCFRIGDQLRLHVPDQRAQVLAAEERGRAAAEIDRVCGKLRMRRLVQLGQQGLDIGFDPIEAGDGVEIAVVAFPDAKWDVDVEMLHAVRAQKGTWR